MRSLLFSLALLLLLPLGAYGQQIITDISVPRGPFATCLFGRSNVRISSPCYPSMPVAQQQPIQHHHFHYPAPDDDDDDEAVDELGDTCQHLISTIQQQMVIHAMERMAADKCAELAGVDDDCSEQISALMSQLMLLQQKPHVIQPPMAVPLPSGTTRPAKQPIARSMTQPMVVPPVTVPQKQIKYVRSRY